MYSDDPLGDFYAHENEIENREKNLPCCSYCGERITEDFYYVVDGMVYCPECMDGFMVTNNG